MKKVLLFLLSVMAQNLVAQVQTLNDAIFEHSVQSARGLVVVKFFTPKCGACQQLESIFTAVSLRSAQVKFMQLNTQVNSRMRNQYQVKTVPVVIFFVNGKEVYRTNKITSEQQLLDLIARYNR